MRKLAICLTIIIASSFMSCSNDDKYNPIPNDIPVYLELFLNSHRDRDLTIHGRSIIYTSKSPLKTKERIGYGGVIVTCTGIGEPIGGYLNLAAYSSVCPHEARPNIQIEAIGDGKAKCSQCGTEYNLYAGGVRIPDTGPSQHNLKAYRVTFAGENTVTFKITR